MFAEINFRVKTELALGTFVFEFSFLESQHVLFDKFQTQISLDFFLRVSSTKNKQVYKEQFFTIEQSKTVSAFITAFFIRRFSQFSMYFNFY